ncbi:hypothetical protein [Mesobacillus subterraneus]|uniref:Uncharacterized protein n=1 Tax=Mesobacillus subterraneus TaxID=285983 RepID=A0A3R9EER6_9BACI|nr:hypothetical protein [Mesobacillus subterraneus]RSD28739.1 hypothetical protein EJA10_03965 [Mesobacillus subterraneus]
MTRLSHELNGELPLAAFFSYGEKRELLPGCPNGIKTCPSGIKSSATGVIRRADYKVLVNVEEFHKFKSKVNERIKNN